MGIADRAAEQARRLAETARTKADELGVREKAAEYAALAKAKADELGVRDRAVEYTGKAAELAGRGVQAATAGVDRVTGGRFHDRLGVVSTKVGETLDRVRPAGAEEPPAEEEVDLTPRAGADVAGPGGAPITPASTNPEADDPEGDRRL